MHVVITGGAGFLGQKLARKLLAGATLSGPDGQKREVTKLTLFDVAAPAPDIAQDKRVKVVTGDIGDKATVDGVVTDSAASVFHLAAVVSGEAEADFDLGWRVNVDAMRALLERCRALGTAPRFVFASSCAAFGGPLPARLPDDQTPTPQSSYGAQKVVGEYLVYDYTRKGFLDGRSLRLPTVTVRPGKPNKAASSFASGIIREPLAGVEAVCPVAPETRMWLTSPATVVDNLIAGHEAAPSAFGHTRSVNLPGISVTVREMVDALARVAGADVASRVVWKRDPAIEKIVLTWPADFEATFARTLGMRADTDFEGIVRAYAAETGPA